MKQKGAIIILFLIAIFGIAVSFLVWQYMQQHEIKSGITNDNLRLLLNNCKDRNQALSKRQTQLEREALLARESYSVLKDELFSLQKEFAALQMQLNQFGLSDLPGSISENGFKLLAIKLNTITKNHYVYNLQFSKTSQKALIANVEFSIRGYDVKNQAITLKQKDILLEDAQTKLDFQVFQKLNGKISLPNDFKPDLFIVRISSNNDLLMMKTFDWKEILVKDN